MGCLSVALMACSSDSDDPTLVNEKEPSVVEVSNELVPIELSRSQQGYVAEQNGTALELLGRVWAVGGGKNVVLSPMGLNMSLSFLANGAAGETQRELTEFVGGPEATLADVNQYCRLMKDRLPLIDNKTTVTIANSLWLDERFSVRQEFVTAGKQWYDATTRVVDIDTEETRCAFNQWAEDNTNELIKNFFTSPLPEETLMVLADALYFKGQWSDKFDASNTEIATFTTASGTAITVHMMDGAIECLGYSNADGLRSATIAYGNGAYAMTVVVDESGHIDQTLAKISATDVLAVNQKTKVHVRMPRFDLDCSCNLTDVLCEMGITKAFTFGADYSALTEDDMMAVGQIIQKSRIKVDEEGAEAAAVTVTEIYTSAGYQNEIVLDRPFVFLIHERTTGAILFTGIVAAVTQ